MSRVAISVCETDADYEEWRVVRMAVVPGERCPSVAEIRQNKTSRSLMVLARRDGVVVGSGVAADAETEGAGFVAPRVLQGARRQGVGTALLRTLSDHCAGLGHPVVRAKVDDEGSHAFARGFGFTEIDREIEQVRVVGDEPEPPPLEGVEVVRLDERPELWDASYERFGREVLADFAVHTPLAISAEEWSTTWRGDPMFVALHDGEVIGCAGLLLDPDHPERAENALTAVRRDWRGRGVAAHLKRLTLHWAAAHGLREAYTWTQTGNAAMARLNEHLGYVTTKTSITVTRPLPMDG
jgi:mycothiol synthase